jgi:hypothetical protein
VAKGRRRRASQSERERRLAELCELLATRATERAVVRAACEKWGLGERAAQKYVADARGRLRESAGFDRRTELGLALAGYELIYRRQLKAGDLRNARTTLDKIVALLGLALPTRERPITLEAIDAEIARLEAELVAREEQTP